jgi:RND family efflux transporter MFP subunit
MNPPPLSLLFATGIAIFSAGCHREPSADEKPPEPVPTVTVEPLKRGSIEEPIIAYGSVVAEPGKNVGLSVPYESTVARTLVVPGQRIKAGDPVVEIAASAATELQLGQAKSTLKTAESDLGQIKQRYDLKLATNQELGQAEKAAADARMQLDSLEKSGASDLTLLRSPAEGIVLGLGSQAGQTVPPGTSFAEIVPADAVEVRIDIEPDDLDALRPGAVVKLSPINQPRSGPLSGTVRLLTASVNPTSRLVSVFVTLPKQSGFLLGGYVQAEFSRHTENALIVPIAALLTEGDAFHVFIARDNKAVERTVERGLRNKEFVEILGADLKESDPVIIEGNYELEDGMSLKMK